MLRAPPAVTLLRGFWHRSLRLNMQTRRFTQFGLARVERAEFCCAQHQRGGHVQNVQAPGANDWGVMFRQAFRFPKESLL